MSRANIWRVWTKIKILTLIGEEPPRCTKVAFWLREFIEKLLLFFLHSKIRHLIDPIAPSINRRMLIKFDNIPMWNRALPGKPSRSPPLQRMEFYKRSFE